MIIKMLLAVVSLVVLSGCTTIHSLNKPLSSETPPILALPIEKSYVQIATVEVTRSVLGKMRDLDADDMDWGYRALRKEACRLGADAIISPQVSFHSQTLSLIPYGEILATGIAIRFL